MLANLLKFALNLPADGLTYVWLFVTFLCLGWFGQPAHGWTYPGKVSAWHFGPFTILTWWLKSKRRGMDRMDCECSWRWLHWELMDKCLPQIWDDLPNHRIDDCLDYCHLKCLCDQGAWAVLLNVYASGRGRWSFVFVNNSQSTPPPIVNCTTLYQSCLPPVSDRDTQLRSRFPGPPRISACTPHERGDLELHMSFWIFQIGLLEQKLWPFEIYNLFGVK